MRSRDDRRRVVIGSRIRCGATWTDARIVDLSSRGVGLSAATPPRSGAYVEIRRGRHIIIARVVWVKGLRFGVRTQDAVPVESVIADSASAEASAGASGQQVERRAVPRPAVRHDRSRTVGRAMEFAFLGIMGASAALLGFDMIGDALRVPLTQVQTALGH